MTEQQRKDAIKYIEAQLEDGYLDLGSHDQDELEVIKLDMAFDKLYPDEWKYKEFNTGTMAIGLKPKIINGSKLTIGSELQSVTIYNIDQHFNWFQKLMWKWCFGIKVDDYSEE